MNANLSQTDSMRALHLHLGPLKYLFLAHDKWGVQILDDVAKHIAPPARPDEPDRIIHLVDDKQTTHHLTKPQLPRQLDEYLPDKQQQESWQFRQNHINSIWISAHSRHCFWTETAIADVGPIRFHLPWSLIIGDMVNHGGGLLHCGLASYGDSGVLFLAPPCGGKSTTLSTAPADWQVLSDDAALVWKDNVGGWLASPLPAWGNIINTDGGWEYSDLVTSESTYLKSMLLIEKSNTTSLERLLPSAVVPSVYRSLCEYPATITADAIHKEEFFQTAAIMCRDLNSYRLSLPLNDNIWPLLVAEAA